MKKFIITEDGTLVFGDVSRHRDLIPGVAEMCHGGGMWSIDNKRGMLLLYGRSFDFGAPDFSRMRRVERTTPPGSLRLPMFYQTVVNGVEVLEPLDRY